jgi:hypothetical protein
MGEEIKGRGKKVELTLDQLVDLQPGLGRLMPEVGRRYWILYYAARGGNWELARLQWRQIRNLFRIGATTRTHMSKHLEAFQRGGMQNIEESLQARDWQAFDRTYRKGIESANRSHEAAGRPEIRWQLPGTPPEELDLRPQSA